VDGDKALLRNIFLLAFACLLLVSCNQNPNQPSTIVGTVDSTAIAADTSTQVNLENSYEYAKSLSVHEHLVFDIRAFGGPASKGEYAIIRRAADNKPDTVAHGTRQGIIADAFLADLNSNKEPEIYLIVQSADSLKSEDLIAYEVSTDGSLTRINVPADFRKDRTHDYAGRDSIYVDEKGLIRCYPLDKKNTAWMKVHYKLIKNEIVYLTSEGVKNL